MVAAAWGQFKRVSDDYPFPTGHLSFRLDDSTLGGPILSVRLREGKAADHCANLIVLNISKYLSGVVSHRIEAISITAIGCFPGKLLGVIFRYLLQNRYEFLSLIKAANFSDRVAPNDGGRIGQG